ncbi:MAG: hypothetical protein AMJ93_15015 [Anaerolineae bacterium SM23_84]|nr:MAG: hypothetical protein AMJ93_15015 [Anaerolineae bacterium SM23_84]
MRFEAMVRSALRRLFAVDGKMALERKIPLLDGRLHRVDEVGLYLHIPFCRQICPYCPYNKELYHADFAPRYSSAVMREIDVYAGLLNGLPVTSFYIGGGTPTTMLRSGIEAILDHAQRSLNVRCGIHMESHPNDLSVDNLSLMRSLGIEHLSIGVEALQEHHLRTLHRPYSVAEVKASVRRAVNSGFKCVNADIMFALPGQTCQELEEAGNTLLELGVDQVAAYPLFTFPYTNWARVATRDNHRFNALQKRRMLAVLESLLYDAGFRRTSVWAFTRPGVPEYCSVTVPLYIGLGASGASYLRDVFYVNTFNVREYTQALEAGRMAIALSLELSMSMQIAGWLYWRIYQTRIDKSSFQRRFGLDFDRVYGRYASLLQALGLARNESEQIVLTDRGAYWLHVLQDLFSTDYVSKLWGTSWQNPWPERVVL